MRIRKSGKFSSEIFSEFLKAKLSQPHMCQLNQSPQDVVSVSFPQKIYPCDHVRQSKRETNFDEIEKFSAPIGAAKGIMLTTQEVSKDEEVGLSTKAADKGKKKVTFDLNLKATKGVRSKSRKAKTKFPSRDIKKDIGKGWDLNCIPQEGNSEDDSQRESPETGSASYYNSNDDEDRSRQTHNPVKKGSTHFLRFLDPLEAEKPGRAVTGARTRRRKGWNIGNPLCQSCANEFYYYSGFGPSWGKRRGEIAEGSKDQGKRVAEDCSHFGDDDIAFIYQMSDDSDSP